MQTFQNTVTIALPADEVFAFLADLSNIPQWNYAIACTVQTSPGPAGVGAAYRQIRTIPRTLPPVVGGGQAGAGQRIPEGREPARCRRSAWPARNAT
jgi:hypothetical protein